VSIAFETELTARLYLYADPTVSGQCFTLAPGDVPAITIPPNVEYDWSGTLAGGTYAIALRADTQPGACGSGPVAANFRYFIDMSARDIIPLDDCGGATVINGPGTYSWDNTGFNSDGTEIPMAHDLWYRYSPNSNALVTLSLCTTTGVDDTQIAIYPDGCPASGAIDYNDDACGASGYEAELTNEIMLDANYYMIQIGTWGEEGAGELTITESALPPQGGNSCSAPVDLDPERDVNGNITGHFFYNTDATTDGPEETSFCYNADDGSTIGLDLWFTWTATQTGVVTAGFCDGTFDGRMEVYEGASCPSLVSPRKPVACDDDACEYDYGVPSTCDWQATAGTTYLLRIGSWQLLPTYPPAGGVADLVITQGVALPHPSNDYCDNAIPLYATLSGVGSSDTQSSTGTLFGATYYSCPYGSSGNSTVWYSITFDACAFVEIYFCGSPTTITYNPYDVQKMWNGCPCTPNEGTEIFEDAAGVINCGGGELSAAHIFNILPPGTYYVPITIGVGGWADPAADFQVNFYVEEVDCQYCDAAGNVLSCPASGSTWIQGVTFADLSRGFTSGTHTEECTGYSDFRTDVADVYEGMTYQLSVNAGKNGGILDANDLVTAYFDWSQDASFYETTPPEKYPLTRVGQNFQGNITIPFGLGGPTGVTVMRLRISKATDGPSSPCGTFTWGEVEDYSLNIMPVPCGDFDGNDVVDAADVATIRDLYFNPASTAPMFWQTADATGDCVFNIADIIYLADYVAGRVGTLECWPCTPL
jgi:hypothetical protein